MTQPLLYKHGWQVRHILNVNQKLKTHQPNVKNALFNPIFSHWEKIGYNPSAPVVILQCNSKPKKKVYELKKQHPTLSQLSGHPRLPKRPRLRRIPRPRRCQRPHPRHPDTPRRRGAIHCARSSVAFRIPKKHPPAADTFKVVGRARPTHPHRSFSPHQATALPAHPRRPSAPKEPSNLSIAH